MDDSNVREWLYMTLESIVATAYEVDNYNRDRALRNIDEAIERLQEARSIIIQD